MKMLIFIVSGILIILGIALWFIIPDYNDEDCLAYCLSIYPHKPKRSMLTFCNDLTFINGSFWVNDSNVPQCSTNDWIKYKWF